MMKSWNIRDLALSLCAVPLDDGGYAEDEVMSLEWAEDAFGLFVGADGESARSANNNGAAIVTLNYAQTAGANDRLSALHKLDLATANGAGAGVFSARDTKGGRLVVLSERAFVMGFPSVVLGKSIKVNAWKIQLTDARLGTFIGGR